MFGLVFGDFTQKNEKYLFFWGKSAKYPRKITEINVCLIVVKVALICYYVGWDKKKWGSVELMLRR